MVYPDFQLFFQPLRLFFQLRGSFPVSQPRFLDLAPVVQKMDSAIQRISIEETNCATHWIEIYPVDSVIHLLNNWILNSFDD